MKKAGLIGIIILLTGIIAFYLLWSKPSNSVQLVKFKGVANATNLSKGYFEWMSTTDSANQLNAIPAMNNDLIYLSSAGNDKGLIMRNQNLTGKLLNIRFDSLGTYLDDRLVSIVIGRDSSKMDQWLSQSSKADLEHLQMIEISDSISENKLQQLKKIGEANSNIGLVINSDAQYFYQIEETLNPSWLYITDGKITSEMISQWNKIDHLECIILVGVDVDQARWDGLKRLKRLHFVIPDSLKDAQLRQLPKGLTTLQISETDIQNLDFLEGLTQLKEVSLNFCGELTDISALTKLPHLTSLSLANCDTMDLQSLSALKELKWFAPPLRITEQELASIVSNNPDLETLVLIDCGYIKSLDMIKDLRKLSCLTLIKTPVVPDSLLRFQDLKYLAYGGEDDKDSLSIGNLQKGMPNTLVTSAEPFCMGTGWLIVFFGLIILLTLVAIRVKSNISV